MPFSSFRKLPHEDGLFWTRSVRGRFTGLLHHPLVVFESPHVCVAPLTSERIA